MLGSARRIRPTLRPTLSSTATRRRAPWALSTVVYYDVILIIVYYIYIYIAIL